MMLDRHVHHLPVLHEGRAIGMVSERDLRNVLHFDRPEQWTNYLDEPVTSIMADNLVSVTPDTDLKDVADRMIENHIGAVVVVDPGNGKLAGIVSYVDVLRVVREALWG